MTGTFSILCIVTKVHLGPASVRCQPADHCPPHLQARLSMCECLHPHLEFPESPPFQGLQKEACHKEPYKGISKIQTFSFFHTAKCVQGSCLSHVHCPVRSRGWQTTPTPSSSYFIETRYFSKTKALRRVNNNTLMKQEGLLGAGERAGKQIRGERRVYFSGRKSLSAKME